jgi:preprotein translocase subunit YajC
MFYDLLLFAQNAADGGAKATDNGDAMWRMLFPLLLILPLFYLLMIRPMRKQEQERQKLISGVKKDDEVLTSSGIVAKFISASDTDDEVVLKLDDGTRIRMLKSSIVSNRTAEKELKAQKEQPK